MAKLLIIDSNRKIWKRLRTRPESQKHRVERVNNVSQAFKLLTQDEFDLVLSDHGIIGANGYEFLREIRRIVPDALIILTSENGGFWQASNTVPADVCDYVTTLSSLEKIEQLIEQALKIQRTRFRTHILRDAEDSLFLQSRSPVMLFLQSRSPVMRRLLENAQQAAVSNGTILLSGESGTGKTLLARQIHPRSAQVGIALVCESAVGLLMNSASRRPRRNYHARRPRRNFARRPRPFEVRTP